MSPVKLRGRKPNERTQPAASRKARPQQPTHNTIPSASTICKPTGFLPTLNTANGRRNISHPRRNSRRELRSDSDYDDNENDERDGLMAKRVDPNDTTEDGGSRTGPLSSSRQKDSDKGVLTSNETESGHFVCPFSFPRKGVKYLCQAKPRKTKAAVRDFWNAS